MPNSTQVTHSCVLHKQVREILRDLSVPFDSISQLSIAQIQGNSSSSSGSGGDGKKRPHR